MRYFRVTDPRELDYILKYSQSVELVEGKPNGWKPPFDAPRWKQNASGNWGAAESANWAQKPTVFPDDDPAFKAPVEETMQAAFDPNRGATFVLSDPYGEAEVFSREYKRQTAAPPQPNPMLQEPTTNPSNFFGFNDRWNASNSKDPARPDYLDQTAKRLAEELDFDLSKSRENF